MVDLPHPWNIYIRVQTALSRGRQLSDQAWGAEAALSGILLSLQNNCPITSESVARTAASEGRRERHRARLRLVHMAKGEAGADPDDALAAREGLRITQSRVSSEDWAVLQQVAEGHSYTELAAQTRNTPGNLRVHVLRCRQRLVGRAA